MNWKFPLLSTEIILEQAEMIVDELVADHFLIGEDWSRTHCVS